MGDALQSVDEPQASKHPIGELFRGEPRPGRDDYNEDDGLPVGDAVQVGVSGSVGGLGGGPSLGVCLCVSLGVGLVAALPPPSCPPPSSLNL